MFQSITSFFSLLWLMTLIIAGFSLEKTYNTPIAALMEETGRTQYMVTRLPGEGYVEFRFQSVSYNRALEEGNIVCPNECRVISGSSFYIDGRAVIPQAKWSTKPSPDEMAEDLSEDRSGSDPR